MTIKTMDRIATKKGDQGSSRNYSNEMYSKDDILFDTLGTIDELSSWLGLSYHHTKNNFLLNIQKILQDINSLIATNKEKSTTLYDKLRRITEEDIAQLELKAQTMLDEKPIEPKFYLPGSDTTLEGAYYDIARAVCRRAERTLVRFINLNKREDLHHPRSYLNRLSDLLFVWARHENNA